MFSKDIFVNNRGRKISDIWKEIFMEKDRNKDNEAEAVKLNLRAGKIFCFTIIGEIEGHISAPSNTKATKYEHIIPELVRIEEDKETDGVLFILNTVGGDVEVEPEDENDLKHYRKLTLEADKYYRFYQEGGNSFPQGSHFTIKLFKKSNNTLVMDPLVYDATGNEDVFDNSYFKVDESGEYYVEIAAHDADDYAMFSFEEDEHETIDEYGFCSICGKYMGQTHEIDELIEKTVLSGEKYFFRVAAVEGEDIEYAILHDGSLSVLYIKSKPN